MRGMPSRHREPLFLIIFIALALVSASAHTKNEPSFKAKQTRRTNSIRVFHGLTAFRDLCRLLPTCSNGRLTMRSLSVVRKF